MNVAELGTLYMEVAAFFRRCGGAYRNMPENSYLNIADALAHGRYLIHRDKGNIVRALMYWRIHPEDLETVRHGGRPADVENGSITYICEHAGIDGTKGLVSAIRTLKLRCPGDGCWHDRYLQPDRFRYYRRRQ